MGAGHVDELVTHYLLADQRPAEGGALSDPGHGEVERALRDPVGMSREGEPFTQTGLTVRLYASYKTASYAPATKQLLATASVVNGQAVLQLKLPASLKGQTITAHANLTGPNYIPSTTNVTIKVT